MTFHIIPWMWGVDGDKTCGISDTIHITDEGCESFFSLDRDFIIKPAQAKKKTISVGKEQPPHNANKKVAKESVITQEH